MRQFNSYTFRVVMGAVVAATSAQAQEIERPETMIEQIVVTSALHRSRAETVLPVNVVGGDTVRENGSATLGEMLEGQVGVNNASFGAGVGLPVIRGQSANRVQVLQMGVGNLDASAVSPDHANSLEPALADRIEVIRGPATLLYGNGAIGGVVNVIDGRIARERALELEGLAEARYDSVNDQRTGVLRLDGGSGRFAWHLDAVDRESNDISLPGFALNPELVDRDDPESLEALLDSRGRLANSHARSDSQTVGASWILDDGWVGVAFNQMDNEYGLPKGAHAHHEHDEDASQDEHDDVHAEDEGDVRVVMEQRRWDSEARMLVGGDWIEEFHGKVSLVDYRHVEVEGGGEIGTRFDNEGVEGRLTLHLNQPEGLDGVLGLQFGSREFSALGEEAFIPATDIDSLALFGLQSVDVGDITWEFGARAERQSLDQSGRCDKSSTNFSGSGAAIWHLNEVNNLLFSINHSQRSATVEERFSNIAPDCNELPADALVAHAATQRLDVGLPDAEREQSVNFELGWRRFSGDIDVEVNLFYNAIDDYLYLNDTGTFVDDVEIARYRQEDARFLGLEALVVLPLYGDGAHQSNLSLFTDLVKARFDDAGNVPRIPPLRFGLEWMHSHVDWLVRLRWTHVDDQTDAARNETESQGFELLSLYGEYRLPVREGAGLLLFARGHNLLDEEIRSHASLLKDVAPSPGRGVEVGLRLEF